MIAAITTMAGFVGLCFADHAGLRSIGNLAMVGVTICTVASIILLPVLFGLLEHRARGTMFGLLPEHHFDGHGDGDSDS